MVHTLPLSYRPDSSLLFEAIRHQPYPVFLDSGLPHSTGGRFDILSANPETLVESDSGLTVVKDLRNGHFRQQSGSPFGILAEVMAEIGYERDPEAMADDWPFTGGALGYFSYDLGRYLESLPSLAERDVGLPDMQVGIYSWAILVDHQQQRSLLLYRNSAEAGRMQTLASQLQRTLAAQHAETGQQALDLAASSFRLKAPFQSNLSHSAYKYRFQRTQNYIQAGDCYQINLAQRFSAPYRGDSWQAYKTLRLLAPTPFSAYLETPAGTVLSLSPERFLQVIDNKVETKPIKGTRPRGQNRAEDEQLREKLKQSCKDRAENLMIVDLLRNDLGKTCVPGSIAVPELFNIESYANVHHLVSTVTGQLTGADARLQLLQDCFPGGSITGAPKVRAMEIIEELEPHRRSVYCGSIGYIGFNGRMDTSISIRTLVAADGWLHCWAGGGLVADSQCEEEYQETFDKVSNLIGPLEQWYLGDN